MNSAADSATRPLRLDRGETFVIGASALANLLLWKILYATGPFTVFLPMIQIARDGNMFPGDALHSVLPHYGTFFYRIIGWLHVPDAAMPALFIGGLLVVLAVIYTLLYLLAREVTGDRWVSSLALMAYALRPRLHFGGSYLGHSFTHGTFAIAILLAGAVLILRDRERVALLLAGIAANFHAIYAALFGAAFTAILLVRVRRIGPVRIICAAAIGIVAALPIIIWKLLEGAPQGELATWLEIIRLRSGSDLFFLEQPWLDYFRFGLLCAGIIIGLAVGVRVRHRNELIAAFAVLAALFSVGIIFVELTPAAVFVRMQLIRASFVIFIFGVPLTLAAMAWIVRKIRFVRLCAGWHLLKKTTKIILLVSGAAGAVTYTAWYFSTGAATADFPRRLVVLRFCIIAVMLGSVVVLAGWRFRPRFARGEGGIYLVLLAATLLLGIGKTALHGLMVRPDADMIPVRQWARRETKPDAIFIIPPNAEGFRFGSHRSVYVTWTDGTLANFDPEYAALWRSRLERMHSYSRSEKGRAESYTGLSRTQFIEAASESGATHVVLSSSGGTVFGNPVFESPRYRIYEMRVNESADTK